MNNTRSKTYILTEPAVVLETFRELWRRKETPALPSDVSRGSSGWVSAWRWQRVLFVQQTQQLDGKA